MVADHPPQLVPEAKTRGRCQRREVSLVEMIGQCRERRRREVGEVLDQLHEMRFVVNRDTQEPLGRPFDLLADFAMGDLR